MTVQIVSGSEKYEKSETGLNSQAKETIKTAFNFFKANAKSISQSISVKEKDYFLHVQDLYGIGMSDELALEAFISLCSRAIERSLQEQTTILGSMTIGGSVGVLENLAGLLQVCLDAGAKRLLIPISSPSKIATVPPDLSANSRSRFMRIRLILYISRWR